MKALACHENEEKQNKLFMNLTRLNSSDGASEVFVNLQGSLMIQEILCFNKPIKLVNSMLATDAGKLAKVLSDPKGCHITDAFMKSTTIGEKSRESLIRTLQSELGTHESFEVSYEAQRVRKVRNFSLTRKKFVKTAYIVI